MCFTHLFSESVIMVHTYTTSHLPTWKKNIRIFGLVASRTTIPEMSRIFLACIMGLATVSMAGRSLIDSQELSEVGQKRHIDCVPREVRMAFHRSKAKH